MPLLKSYEQKQGVGSKSRVLLMSSAPSTTEGVGTPPKPALRPASGTCPYPHPNEKWACPTAGKEQGNMLFVLAPSCCSRGPSKALPEFLIWPPINFYWSRRPRTLVGNRTIFTRADWRMSPKMGKEIITQVQETQRVPNRINPRQNTPRHILIKLKRSNTQKNKY